MKSNFVTRSSAFFCFGQIGRPEKKTLTRALISAARMPIMAPGPDKPKARRTNTRSRTGCVSCRQKHIRCDERRPSCFNCTLKEQLCSYVPKIPLRERRAGPCPGQQAPWAVEDTRPITHHSHSHKIAVSSEVPSIQVLTIPSPFYVNPWEAFDPFDTLPINMPLRSKELLHYSQQFSKLAALIVCYPEIRMIGNLAIAEFHLKGLMTYLDSQRAEPPGQHIIDDVQVEQMNRYLILDYNVVHCLKSRSDDTLATYASSQGKKPHSHLRGLANLKHGWPNHEASDLDLRLRALRMVPFFFGSVPQGSKPKNIDMYPTITALRNITKLADTRHAQASADVVLTTSWKVWDSGGSSDLLFAVISAHHSSLADKIQLPSCGNQTFISSWSGFCVGVGMYLIAALGIWNQGLPMEKQLHYHILRILTQDLRNDLVNLQSMSRETRDTWLWKAFVGSLSVVHAQLLFCDKRLDSILEELASFIRNWTKITGVVAWSEAREMLSRVVWPVSLDREDRFESLWAKLI
ncbi:hypothetical protein CCUS01_08231 [Colletotrichum cuscutae]|uniref:Zn(2)-C6 fungal-type domain-containing protein n=1 Tax=Colletotrichum cuscutae TaxID=1209917 RepID=A0AAI9USB9_9PEZI|nr:hypothetical protein CCUS01_08231 [Colletotrichum cuscutae]